MTRAALILLTALACVSSVLAQGMADSGGGTIASTASIATTATGVVANGIWIVTVDPTQTGTPSVSFVSLHDTFGLIFTQIAADSAEHRVFCAPIGSNSGSDTLTVTYSGPATNGSIVAQEFLDATCTLDGTPQITTSPTNPINGNYTITANQDLVLTPLFANFGAGGGCADGNVPSGNTLGIVPYWIVVTPSGTTFSQACAPNSAGGVLIMLALLPSTLGPFPAPIRTGASANCQNPCAAGTNVVLNVLKGETLIYSADWCANPTCSSLAGSIVSMSDSQSNAVTCTSQSGPNSHSQICFTHASASGSLTVNFTNIGAGGTHFYKGIFVAVALHGGTFGPCDWCSTGGATSGSGNLIQVSTTSTPAAYDTELWVGSVINFNTVACRSNAVWAPYWPLVTPVTPPSSIQSMNVTFYNNVAFAIVHGVAGTIPEMTFDCTQSAGLLNWSGSFMSLKYVPPSGLRSQVYDDDLDNRIRP